MSKIVFILGRDPLLSLAEIQALFPEATPEYSTDAFAFFDFTKSQPDFNDFKRLGGTIKTAVIKMTATSHELSDALAELIVRQNPDSVSKIVYGVSVYGWPEEHLHSLLMRVKERHQKKGIKSRFINKGNVNLTAAHYLHLLKEGREFAVIRVGGIFHLGEVVGVQDIEHYSQRDYGKPFRDMRMGMLPPKLAQILLNLSGVHSGQTVWDPFCGGGTILMEGALMGLNMIGSDINPTYLAGAQKNIDWLKHTFSVNTPVELFEQDATRGDAPRRVFTADTVVFEGDLGPPLSPSVRPDQIQGIVGRLQDLYFDFFSQRAAQLKKGTVIVSALPFFRAGHREFFLTEVVKAIQNEGLQLDPFLAGERFRDVLLYRRPDQAVGRGIYRFKVL
ncbi:hypothetical protein HZA43_05135 [Candidatus Peregrinibacteria bacterium]|nr:hypothetical protein [Candidatus Peregrinibacteria bacterium]